MTGGYRTSVTLEPGSEQRRVDPGAGGSPRASRHEHEHRAIGTPQSTGLGATGLRPQHQGAPGLGTTGVGAAGVSTAGFGATGLGSAGLRPAGLRPTGQRASVSATAPGEPANGTEVTYTVTNTGNTETTYDAFLNVPGAQALLSSGNYNFQVLITRTSLAPGFLQTANGCVPAADTKVQVLANIQIPNASAPQVSAILFSSTATNSLATFSVAPAGGADVISSTDGQSPVLRDEVKITLRAIRLKSVAEIVAANGQLFNPQTVEVKVASTSTNVLNGQVQGDSPDDAPVASSGGPSVVTNTGDSGAGSLRAAILAANAAPDTNTISFNIPGAGPHTITPASPLPTITNPVVLDGTTQSGYAGTPVIQLGDGSGAVTVPGNGLHLTGGNSIVRGLAINGFVGEGIRVEGGGSNVIERNYIGTSLTGTADRGNGNSGIFIPWSDGNYLIGNVISGNDGFAGVAICGFTVCGGGARPGGATLSTGNVLQGNLIGTNAAGTGALGNTGFGVSIDGASGTLVGGASVGMPNIIANNGSHGVHVFNSPVTGNRIVGNSIHSNGGLGIDLPASGPIPVLTSVVLHPAGNSPALTVEGTLDGAPATPYVLDFYNSAACDASGSGEGQMWVGTSTITGAGTFTVGLPALNLGTVLTALATSLEGGTSMFSQCRMVLPAGFAEWPVSQDGNGSIYEYVRQGGLSWTQANAEAQARTILGRTGRLVSISSASENAFVNALRDGGPMRAWIGLFDTDGAGDVPGPWSWTSGEGFTFSNWNQANPDALEPNNPGTEFWVEMFGDGTWNNNTVQDVTFPTLGYIVEYPPPPVIF